MEIHKQSIGSWVALVFIVICLLFTALRVYNLEESFFFQNDTGRDMLTLQRWHETGKPPLLGPQTNAIAFNQSALYFYFFYPIFVLSDHSFFTTHITLLLIHIIIFFAGISILRRDRKLLLVLIFCAGIFTIHPQTIIQHRYVWNPSFVPLFLIASYFFFRKSLEYVHKKYRIGFAVTAALAVGMSVSAIPALLAFLTVLLWKLRRKRIQFLEQLLYLIGAHILVFAPMILFEIKYNFQITRRILAQGFTTHAEASTFDISALLAKAHLLMEFILPDFFNFRTGIGVVVFLAGILMLHLLKKKQLNWQVALSEPLIELTILFLLTTTLIVLSPVALEGHYIFGALTFLVLWLAQLPYKWTIATILLLSSAWLHPTKLTAYFQPAPRTVAELQQCATLFCATHTEPMLVSTQAGFHNYHSGYEFQYLLKENGCAVVSADSATAPVEFMVVVADLGTYVHGVHAFMEVSQFGPSVEREVFVCSPQVQLHLLQKE